jgi:hypothetical protein
MFTIRSEVAEIDVDINIPKTAMRNPNAIGLVIGNRKYQHPDVPEVRFAHHDAETVRQYLIKTLAYKEGNIFFETDVIIENLWRPPKCAQ